MHACIIAVAVLRSEVSVGSLQNSRRGALGMLAGAAALITRTEPSQAAYGEAANVFGKSANVSGACVPPLAISRASDMFKPIHQTMFHRLMTSDYARQGPPPGGGGGGSPVAGRWAQWWLRNLRSASACSCLSSCA